MYCTRDNQSHPASGVCVPPLIIQYSPFLPISMSILGVVAILQIYIELNQIEIGK